MDRREFFVRSGKYLGAATAIAVAPAGIAQLLEAPPIIGAEAASIAPAAVIAIDPIARCWKWIHEAGVILEYQGNSAFHAYADGFFREMFIDEDPVTTIMTVKVMLADAGLPFEASKLTQFDHFFDEYGKFILGGSENTECFQENRYILWKGKTIDLMDIHNIIRSPRGRWPDPSDRMRVTVK